MAYIRVEVGYTIKNGSKVSFRAPCDCNKVVGLKVYFPTDNGVRTYQTFLFTDAHGNNLTGVGHLFKEGAIVKAVLSLDTSRAYLQNADTNKYLEDKFKTKADLQNGKVPASQLPAMDFIPTNEKGAAGGVATLGTDKKVPAEQLPAMYTKAETLTDATKAQFGMGASAVPNDVLAYLSKYSQHWWKRQARQDIPAKYELSERDNSERYFQMWPDNSLRRTIYASTTIEVNADGTVNFTGVTFEENIWKGSYSASELQAKLRGKFVWGNTTKETAVNIDPSEIFFMYADADLTIRAGDYGWGVHVTGSSTVSTDPAKTERSEPDFVQSVNENAYPKTGVSDGYEYEYMGIPLDNAVAAGALLNRSTT